MPDAAQLFKSAKPTTLNYYSTRRAPINRPNGRRSIAPMHCISLELRHHHW